jgi:tetratricopeptide (TPR) repeat protein
MSTAAAPGFRRWLPAVSLAVLSAFGVVGNARGGETAPLGANKPADAELQAALKEGDKLFVAQQFPEAERAYQRAVKRPSVPAEVYARLAAVLIELGKLDEAFDTLAKGLETAGTDTERAKLIFLQADVRERQQALPKAGERWNAYLEATGASGERTIDLDAPEEEAPAPVAAKGENVYPASAHERLRQVEAAQKRFKDYGAVKERIRKREAEAEAKARRAR